jgi:valyl-tRNA synthetase
METGYDILFFWVARMIMMGLEDTGDIPFQTVYLHGLIRDENGEKMSKLRGNVINPAEAIAKYGVDALRFALTTGSSPGNDINLGRGKLESSRNFVNKLWNAARFILQSIDAQVAQGKTLKTEIRRGEPLGLPRIEDRWINSQLNRLVNNVTKLMEEYQFGEAERQIYDFIWSEFCDWYIEIAKMRLRDHSTPSPLPILANTLEISLRLLHPFMPFITEELWQSLLRAERGNLMLRSQLIANNMRMPASIMIAPYPVAANKAIDLEAERVMDSVIEIIRSIRNARAQYKVAPSKWIEAQVYADDLLPYINSEAEIIEILSRVRPLTVLPRNERKPNKEALVMVLKETEVVLPWVGMLEPLAEKQRLMKEKEVTQARIAHLDARLADSTFLTKAPPHIIEKEKQKLDMLKDKLERLTLELSQLGF